MQQAASVEMCHCGKPLHYRSTMVKNKVERAIKDRGTHVRVVQLSTNRSFWVPLHYIALHGIREQDLPTYGFKEITNVPQGQEHLIS